jgi:beta-fructofuranosidase
MDFIDFSDRKNRYVRKSDVGEVYVEKMKQKVAEDTNFYPTSHLVPPHGLLNDPNGLYQDDEGWYHIYYQWFPLGTVHGLKHWYHVKTKDFLHYESFGPALFPEDTFDAYGCFTGMALVDEDDGVHLYYTGIRKEGDDLLPATIHAVIEEGEIKKTGIIENIDLTKTTMNYRDPFVFKRKDNYYMITGAENCQNEGILLISQGDSPTNFQSTGTIRLMDYPFGYMLECPNYFENEINGVLIFSPQGIQKVDPYDFQNVFSVVYAVGNRLDVETNTFQHESFYELDKGFDFYAPQVFQDKKGRHILYGWLGITIKGS